MRAVSHRYLFLALIAVALVMGGGWLASQAGSARADGAGSPPSLAEQLRYVGRDTATGMPAPVDDRFIAQVEHEISRYGKDAGEPVPPPPVSGTDVSWLTIPKLGVERAPVGRYGVDAYGRLDVMVTNAGVLRDKVLWKMTDEDFDLVVATHLRGTFTCARAAAIRFRDQGDGGRIIVVGSPAGQHGNFGQTNYAAAKAGIVAFARTWAMELARANVTVNAIVPTAWTRMTASIPIYAPLVGRDEFPPEVRREHALGTPDDCAPLVVYLASDAAAGVTGQALGIGGDRLSLYSHPSEIAHELRDGGWTADAIAEAVAAFDAQPFGVRLPELDLS
jgi:3-oxoacyl-[acyl-carrier protein] reductase